MGKKVIEKTHSPVTGVFVSGIPYQCTEDHLRQFFDGFSVASIKLPKYQDTGRCLGYAHISFSSKEDQQAALTKNGQHLGNRYLTITSAKGEKKKEVQQVTVPVGCKVLFVKNLPYQISQSQIREEFASCGIVTDVRMVRNWANKKFKGFAYIDYRDFGSVKKAITKYNGKQFKGRTLILDAVATQMRKGFKRRDDQPAEQQQELIE